MSSSALTFVPWLRRGLATKITQAPDATTGRPVFQVNATISHTPSDGGSASQSSLQNDLDFRGYGPGDIKGLSESYIQRLEPKKGTLDLEPNYTPFVEFSDPTLPWLFSPTPTSADSDALDALLPWFVLLVVPESEDVSVGARVPSPNPVLSIGKTTLGAESDFLLPDLSTSTWWAHVEVAGDWNQTATGLEQLLDNAPERVSARMLCPVKLKPETKYIGCLVPTYKRGVQSGLGQTVDAGGTELAWASDANSTLESLSLPVYFSWRFRTGRAGDFESLARRLEPFEASGNIGSKPLEVDLVEFGLASEGDPEETRYSTIDMQGVLRAPSQDPPSSSQVPTSIQDVYLNEILDEHPRSAKPKIWIHPFGDLQEPAPGTAFATLPDARFRTFGDGDFHRLDATTGRLYVPVGGGPANMVAVFDVDTATPAINYVSTLELFENPGPAGTNAPWVAINPRNGLLYSSAFFAEEAEFELLVYEPPTDPSLGSLSFVGRMPLYESTGYRAPFNAKRIQGGAFSAEGHLYVVRDTADAKGGIHAFEMVHGRHMAHIPIMSPYGSNEGAGPAPRFLQGLDIAGYTDPEDASATAQLHVLLSQANPTEVTIKHLGVPTGEESKV